VTCSEIPGIGTRMCLGAITQSTSCVWHCISRGNKAPCSRVVNYETMSLKWKRSQKAMPPLVCLVVQCSGSCAQPLLQVTTRTGPRMEPVALLSPALSAGRSSISRMPGSSIFCCFSPYKHYRQRGMLIAAQDPLPSPLPSQASDRESRAF
jgi:hypothetical protein